MTATLRGRLEQGRVPLDEALPLVQGLCAELARAHARGRVHGRLSPETVKIVVGAWEVDFAAARPDDGDERDDVRAVAEILTEALTGETGTAAAMRLPPGVRGPILRSLHAQRERRHGTIEELARALGVPLPEPPRQRRVGWPWIAASALLAGVASGAVRLSAVEIAPRLVAPVVAPAPARLTLRIEGTPALVDMLVTALAERPRLEVVRRGEASLVLRADVDGGVLQARLVDATRDATVLGERRTLGSSLIAEAGALAERIAAATGAGAGPSLAALTTGSDEAYRAYLDGLREDEAALRRAVALDPSFFAPRLKLAESSPAELPAAAALAGRAGRRGALALARVAARTPEARLAALEAERDFAPHDGAIAALLAPAYRARGDVGRCAAEAGRAVAAGLDEAAGDLAWCRAAAGDEAGAIAVAAAAGDALLLGDVLAFHGRAGEARTAYARAGAAAAARLAWLSARLDARCPKGEVPVASLDDARAAFAVARACGDVAGAERIEAALRRAGEPLADELDGRAPVVGDDPIERGRRLGPRLAAARASGKAAEALAGFAPVPIDRNGLFEAPLLLEVALTQIAAGDAEAAALTCEELAGPVELYCRGRAAEAAGRYGAAFAAYRDLADRWADADPRHRMASDTVRRMRAAVAHARAARGE